MLCMVFFLLCAGPIQAQPEVRLFDGKTTHGWVIEGDAEVKDGVLVLGGSQKTRVRIAADFSPDFELRLEYRTENDKPIQIESHFGHFSSQGSAGSSLCRSFTKPGEWIEANYQGKEKPAGNGWATTCSWRVVGKQACTVQEVGGSSGVPRSVFVALEVPVGQKLYLRNVRLKRALMSPFPWCVRIIKLEGELLAPWVEAVRVACAQQGGWSKQYVLDLTGVTYVEGPGSQLLRDLVDEGVQIGSRARATPPVGGRKATCPLRGGQVGKLLVIGRK
jgi:hypothetical protein